MIFLGGKKKVALDSTNQKRAKKNLNLPGENILDVSVVFIINRFWDVSHPWSSGRVPAGRCTAYVLEPRGLRWTN